MLFAGVTVSDYQLNLLDGQGYRSIPEARLAFTCPNVDSLFVSLKATTSLGALEGKVLLYVVPAAEPAGNPTARYTNNPDDIFADFNLTSNTGAHDGGHITVQLAQSRRGVAGAGIQRPLIILEGVDYAQVAPELLREEDGSDGNFAFADIIRWLSGPNPEDLGFDMDNISDRDLIFVDYLQGHASIKRNAELFKAVVRWVNSQRTGTAPTVVIGISMGGLVARYGLCEMDKQGEAHQVGLLLTHDSPHRGANNPLGLQFFVRGLQATEVLDVLGSTREAIRILEADATKEMLLVRARDKFGGVDYNTFLNGEYRQMVDYPAGQTPGFRFVTTSLGSECNTQLIPPSSLIAQFNGWNRILGLLRLEIAANMRSLPPQGQQIVVTQLRVSLGVNPGRRWLPIRVNTTVREYRNPPNLPPHDGMAGGFLPAQGGSSFYNVLWLFMGRNAATGILPHCIVPVASARDQADISMPNLNRPYNYLTQVATRQAAYITQGPLAGRDNFQHPFLTPRTVLFIAREVNRPDNPTVVTTQGFCPANCVINPTITGPDLLCNGAQGQYSLNWPGQGTLTTYNWAMNLPLGSSNGPQVTVQIPATGMGQGSLSVSAAVQFLDGAQCPVTANKTVEYGLDPTPLTINATVTNLISASGSTDASILSIPQMSPATDYIWRTSSNAITLDQNGLADNQVRVTPVTNAYGYPSVDLEVVTSCGSFLGTTQLHVYPCCRMPVLNPNPAIAGEHQEVEVSLFRDQAGTPAEGPFEWELFDARKEKVRDGSASTNPFSFEIGGLEPATYSVEVKSNDGNWIGDVNIVSQAGSHLTASPNPARKDVDEEVIVHVVGGPAQGQYELTLSTFGGQVLRQMQGTEPVFRLPMQGMDAGTYVITVTEGTQTWTEDLDFLLKTAPYLTVSPNPASGLVVATMVDPLYPGSTYTWELVDLNGNVLLQGSQTGEELHIDAGQAPTGYHTLIVFDGKNYYQKHLTVVR